MLPTERLERYEPPGGPNGWPGLLEFHGFEMPPDLRISLAGLPVGCQGLEDRGLQLRSRVVGSSTTIPLPRRWAR